MSEPQAGTPPAWRRLGRPGVIGGLIALGIGLWVMAEASGYAMGTARRMGPGFFPVLLGGLMAAMGAALTGLSLWRDEDAGRPRGPSGHANAEAPAGALSEALPGDLPDGDDARADPRALLAVLAGLGAFALLLPRAGLVPAVAALVLISAQGSGQLRLPAALVLAGGLAALSWAVFRAGLGLPLPAFGGRG